MSKPVLPKAKKKSKRMKSLPHAMEPIESKSDVPSSPAVRNREKDREKEKEKRSKRSVATRSFRSAKEFIYSSGEKSAKEELESSFVIRSPRENSRSPRNRNKSVLSSRPKIGHKKTPYDTYSRVTMNLFNAMAIDEETQKILFHTIKKSSGMKKIKNQNVCSANALTALENIEIDIRLLRSDQKRQTAALLIQTTFRAIKQRKEFRKTMKEFQKNKIQSFRDLCSKEKDFVMSLATLVSQYIVPLRVSQDKHLKKISADLHDVFSSIEKILEVHQTLLKTLYELPRNSWPHLNGLGEVFTYVSPHWKIYGVYVHNFKFASKALEDSMDNNEHFRDFCERKQQLASDLTMLLALPLNHISGYAAHLKSILEATPEDSPEHHSLLQAISITSETSNFIGNSMSQAENLATIHRIRSDLVTSPETENLLSSLEENHSKYVMEIPVEFVPQGTKKSYQGNLYLFENVCFAVAHTHKGRTIKHVYDLKELSVDRMGQSNNTFALFVIDEEKPSYDCIIENTRLIFNVESADKVEHIVQNIQSLIAHNQRNRTFGIPIETLIERDNQDDGIPIILKDIVQFIEKHGMDTVGIFRIPGTATAIKKAKTIFNQCNGNYPSIEELGFMHPNDAAGLLKMFFHDLPEPLIPHELYLPFINIFPTESKNIVVVLQEVKNVIDRIPEEKKKVLRFVIGFLVRIAAVEENKMGPSNLATCFGTNILRPIEQTIESTLAIPKSNSCVECLIQYYDILFGETVVSLRPGRGKHRNK